MSLEPYDLGRQLVVVRALEPTVVRTPHVLTAREEPVHAVAEVGAQ